MFVIPKQSSQDTRTVDDLMIQVVYYLPCRGGDSRGDIVCHPIHLDVKIHIIPNMPISLTGT